MNMTREEAAVLLKMMFAFWANAHELTNVEMEAALNVALSALRHVSREQVILCRDCRFWQDNNGGYPHPECRWGNDETPDADDYCSFAERK